MIFFVQPGIFPVGLRRRECRPAIRNDLHGETLEERYCDFLATPSFLSNLPLTGSLGIALFEYFLEPAFVHVGVPLQSVMQQTQRYQQLLHLRPQIHQGTDLLSMLALSRRYQIF